MSCSAQLLSKNNRGFVDKAFFGSRKEEFRKEKEGVRFLCMECICSCKDVDLKEFVLIYGGVGIGSRSSVQNLFFLFSFLLKCRKTYQEEK